MKLRVYGEMLEVLRSLPPLLKKVERCDPDLHRQLPKAAASVLLNLAEGEGSSGGNRVLRFKTALGSAQETKACLHAADALEYCTVPEPVMERVDKVIGMTVRLVYQR